MCEQLYHQHCAEDCTVCSVHCTEDWTLHSVQCTHAQITTVSEDATHRKLSQGGYCNLLNWPWLFHNPFKERSLHILFVVLSQIKAFSIVFMGFLCHEMEITRRGIYLANEIIMPKALQTGITIPGITIPDKGGEICKGLDYSYALHKNILKTITKGCFSTLPNVSGHWTWATDKCENISRVWHTCCVERVLNEMQCERPLWTIFDSSFKMLHAFGFSLVH